MDPYTHLATGILLGSLPPAQAMGWVGTAATVAGSLAPDLDFVTRRLGGTRFLYHHHGATHSIPGLALLGAAVATGLWILRPDTSWTCLWLLAFGSGLLHDLLDILMHNTGVQLLFPLTHRRVAHPLLIGVNPPLLSPGCGDARYATCFACQLRQSLRNPVWWILMLGGCTDLVWRLAGLEATGRFWAAACLLTAAGFLLFAEVRRQRALRRSGLSRDALVFPAAQGLTRYLVLERRPGGVEARLVDLRSEATEVLRFTDDWRRDPLIRSTEALPDVIRFRRVARVPHARVVRPPPETLVEWTDLSYAYPSPFPLFALRLRMDPDGRLRDAEFREHW